MRSFAKLYKEYMMSSADNTPDSIGLTPREKFLVTSTWEPVKKDPLKYGIELFLIFFKMYPHYQKYFSFRNVPYEELSKHKRLHAHATTVIYSLSSILDNLDDPEVIVVLLQKLGESHGKRKIPPKAYDDLIESVIKTLQEGLGDKFTEETSKAWRKTLEVAMNVIKTSLNTV